MHFTREDTKAAKGAAVLLMVYHHLFLFPQRIAPDIAYSAAFPLWGNTSAYWVADFGKICVALFMFLGGYGTYISFARSSNLSRTVWEKLKGLYRGYWQVFFVFIPICMLLHVERVTATLNDFLWNASGMKITYCGEWWFFMPYVGLTCLMPVLFRMLQKPRDVFTDLIQVLFLNLGAVYVLPRITGYHWAAGLSGSLFWNVFYYTMQWAPLFALGGVFAKHDLISKVMQRCSGDSLPARLGAGLLSGAALGLVFYIRVKNAPTYDFALAPAFTVAFAVFINNLPGRWVRRIFVQIGSDSTVIWLTHSLYAYFICQKFVFWPKYTVLIVLWLVLICCVTAFALRKLYGLLDWGVGKLRQHI